MTELGIEPRPYDSHTLRLTTALVVLFATGAFSSTVREVIQSSDQLL